MVFDAGARLAEGRSVVDDVAEYVAACRQLGHPYPGPPVDELYGAQDGIHLGALDADIAALRATGSAADDVAGRQAAAAAVLQNGWAGAGAAAALDFLARQRRATDTVCTAVRDAADVLSGLRDELWRAVDAQVAATLEMGAAARRETWLAAARALATGAGDRAAASELVALEVKPFVDNVVGVQWVAAMRGASGAVTAAYDTALARLSAAGPAVFDVPFELGPRPFEPEPETPRPAFVSAPSSVSEQPMGSVNHAATVPAAFAAPPSLLEEPVTQGLSPPVAADPLLGTATPGSAPAVPSVPSMPGGSPLADLLAGLSGLVGPSEGGEYEPGPLDLDDTGDEEEEPEPDEEDEEAEGEEAEGEEEADGEPVEERELTEPAPELQPEPVTEPAPTPVAEPVAAPPPPLPEETPASEPTPCEIAADELPHVGE